MEVLFYPFSIKKHRGYMPSTKRAQYFKDRIYNPRRDLGEIKSCSAHLNLLPLDRFPFNKGGSENGSAGQSSSDNECLSEG